VAEVQRRGTRKRRAGRDGILMLIVLSWKETARAILD
jgi:hypothetical protein